MTNTPLSNFFPSIDSLSIYSKSYSSRTEGKKAFSNSFFPASQPFPSFSHIPCIYTTHLCRQYFSLNGSTWWSSLSILSIDKENFLFPRASYNAHYHSSSWTTMKSWMEGESEGNSLLFFMPPSSSPISTPPPLFNIIAGTIVCSCCRLYWNAKVKQTWLFYCF